MSMYFFTFLAVPTPDAKEFHEAGGAYVNCWIQEEDKEKAQESATDLIQDYGWTVESLEEAGTVTSDDYGLEDEDRQFYEQALMEGEVLVFNTWPRGDDDEEEEGGDAADGETWQ